MRIVYKDTAATLTSQSAFGRSTLGPPRSENNGWKGIRVYDKYGNKPYSLSERIVPEKRSNVTSHSEASSYRRSVESCVWTLGKCSKQPMVL